MKITVRIGDVEVVVDRPGFQDNTRHDGEEAQVSVLKNSVIPTIQEAVSKAKELYYLTQKTNDKT